MLKILDWKYISLTVFLLALSFLSYIFKTQVFLVIQAIIEFPYLNIFAGTFTAIITIVHKIKTRKFRLSPSMSFNEFRIPVEDMLSFVGSTITIVGSLALAKGIYLQTTTGIKYFLSVDNGIELSFIGLVVAYLFYISVMELATQCKEICVLNIISNESIKPIPESEVKDEVPPIS